MSFEADDARSPCTETAFATFDLTESELIFAEKVLSGRSVAEIATERGILLDRVHEGRVPSLHKDNRR